MLSLRIMSLRSNLYRSTNCLYDTESLSLRFFMEFRERPLGRVVFALKEEPLKETVVVFIEATLIKNYASRKIPKKTRPYLRVFIEAHKEK